MIEGIIVAVSNNGIDLNYPARRMCFSNETALSNIWQGIKLLRKTLLVYVKWHVQCTVGYYPQAMIVEKVTFIWNSCV